MAEDAPTEAILGSTRDLDRRSVEEILAAVHTEDGATICRPLCFRIQYLMFFLTLKTITYLFFTHTIILVN
jgi:hypothetical protein